MAAVGGRLSGAGVGMAIGQQKPVVPMKLFANATWEIDRTPPHCIPRLCSLTLTRLVVQKPLDIDSPHITVAMKMQSSKRVLRSSEIELSPGGLLDTELDLSFSLQYPHYLKRDDNYLQVMLQRRKNRPMRGFRTLAVGLLNMNQVLQQKSSDHELSLYIDPAAHGGGDSRPEDGSSKRGGSASLHGGGGGAQAVAFVKVVGLTSLPVDSEEIDRSNKQNIEPDASDEEDDYSSEGSDTDEEADPQTRARKNRRKQHNARQRNLKQKFISLLRKFKLPEEALEAGAEQDIAENKSLQDLDILLEGLEDSDSAPDADSLSVSSTPKPSLRPYFSARSGSREYLTKMYNKSHRDKHSDDSSKKDSGDSHTETLTDQEVGDVSAAITIPKSANVSTGSGFGAAPSPGSPPRSDDVLASGGASGGGRKDRSQLKAKFTLARPLSERRDKEEKQVKDKGSSDKGDYKDRSRTKDKAAVTSSASVNVEAPPRKDVLDQLTIMFASKEDIPSKIIFISSSEPGTEILADHFRLHLKNAIINSTAMGDVRATFQSLVNRIQKFCNTNSAPPKCIKMGVIGTDADVNVVLRHFVETFSQKSPDWLAYVKFFLVPLGSTTFGKYLSSVDAGYQTNFQDKFWSETFSHDIQHRSPLDHSEAFTRISRYLSHGTQTVNLPVAEAMIVTHKEKEKTTFEDDSSQTFVPFINSVFIGMVETTVGIASQLSVDQDQSADLSVTSTSTSLLETSMQQQGQGSPPGAPLDTLESVSDSVLASPPVDIGPLAATMMSPESGTAGGVACGGTAGSDQLPGSPSHQPHHSPAAAVSSSTAQRLSPPGSPNLNSSLNLMSSVSSYSDRDSRQVEPLELQVEYWSTSLLMSRLESGGGSGTKEKTTKCQLKTTFRYLQVQRAPPSSHLPQGQSPLTLVFATKEKKQKIMRLGKKSKDRDESKSQTVDGISRLICTSKSQHSPLKVIVDGVEWSPVRFFQVSAQWQTHIKYFPVGLFSMDPA